MPNKILRPNIGQRIRAARKYADLTLAEVSRRVGISNQALSAIERGKKNPSRQTLMGLARVFNNNFGEVWLADYLSEHQTEVYLVPTPQGPNIDKVNLMQLFEEFVDTKYGVGRVKVVQEPKERTVSIAVGYEILKTSFEVIKNVEEYIEAPPEMFPTGKGAIAGIVRSKSLRDAFVNEGDLVIITERPRSINGKTILAVANDKILLRRCEVEGDEVVLRAYNENVRPIRVPVKEIVCVGEVTGVIRVMERCVSG